MRLMAKNRLTVKIMKDSSFGRALKKHENNSELKWEMSIRISDPSFMVHLYFISVIYILFVLIKYEKVWQVSNK